MCLLGFKRGPDVDVKLALYTMSQTAFSLHFFFYPFTERASISSRILKIRFFSGDQRLKRKLLGKRNHDLTCEAAPLGPKSMKANWDKKRKKKEKVNSNDLR